MHIFAVSVTKMCQHRTVSCQMSELLAGDSFLSEDKQFCLCGIGLTLTRDINIDPGRGS